MTIEEQIIEKLMSNLSKRDLDLEVGRFIPKKDLMQNPDSLHMWIIKQNTRQITEKTVDLEDFPDFEINLTFVAPSFFTDVYEGLDIPYWQIATIKRVLKGCKIIYDPQEFVKFCVEKTEHLTWNPESIELKRNVSKELLKKSQHFIDEDMLADAVIWAIKAVEEAICSNLMKNGLFNVTTPSLLLDSLRSSPELLRFYTDLLGIDVLTPDLAFVSLKELENLAEYLYHAPTTPKHREEWLLTSFVSINEAERKLLRVLKHAGDDDLDMLSWESLFEDALAELWQAYFIAAQTPWNKEVPLDPWVVGLFWKWFVNETPKYEVEQILQKTEAILENGSPILDFER